jgi:UDP-N-acetylglucosamine 2-epimerase (non-hydrolysing)
MKLLICYGTRPEYIKVKPLIEYFKGKVDFGTMYIEQHDKWFTGNQKQGTLDFEYKPDHVVNIGRASGDRLNSVFSQIMVNATEPITSYTHVLVQGDTASVLAAGICAFNLGKKVIHLEAGLRTHNLEHPYPEEGYRQMISRIADLNLCPTLDAAGNLDVEHVEGKIEVVGNTVLDNLKGIKTSYGDKVLITMHRRENRPLFVKWFEAFQEVAFCNPQLDFILPLHPSVGQEFADLAPHVDITPPMNHSQLIDVLKDCRFVVTDSGGIQEEASFLGKRGIVCRKTTERSEGLGSFFKLCESPSDLGRLIIEYNTNYVIKEPCPFGDGNSAKAIFNEFKKRYSDMCLQ